MLCASAIGGGVRRTRMHLDASTIAEEVSPAINLTSACAQRQVIFRAGPGFAPQSAGVEQHRGGDCRLDFRLSDQLHATAHCPKG